MSSSKMVLAAVLAVVMVITGGPGIITAPRISVATSPITPEVVRGSEEDLARIAGISLPLSELRGFTPAPYPKAIPEWCPPYFGRTRIPGKPLEPADMMGMFLPFDSVRIQGPAWVQEFVARGDTTFLTLKDTAGLITIPVKAGNLWIRLHNGSIKPRGTYHGAGMVVIDLPESTARDAKKCFHFFTKIGRKVPEKPRSVASADPRHGLRVGGVVF